MKTQTKKLLLVLILVVSIMAILITASQIYDILENEKVIDNDINGTDGEENNYTEGEIEIINENNPVFGVNWDPNPVIPYPPSFPLVRETIWFSNPDNTRTKFTYYIQYGGIHKRDSLSSHIDDDSLTGSIKYKTGYTDPQGTEHDDNTEKTASYTMLSSFSSYPDIIFQNIPTNRDELADYLFGQFNIAGLYYEYDFSVDVLDWHIYFLNYVDVKQIVQFYNADTGEWQTQQTIYMQHYVNERTVLLTADSYETGTKTFSYGSNPKFSLETNELLRTDTTIEGKKLSQYNYEQITGEWSEGKELATIKCSIGEYYEYNSMAQDHKGALAISTQNNDLPMLFNIGDLVIPYIAVANGQTEPLSIKLDGYPKVFKVTQIRPYFDGAFWQEIQVQESKFQSYDENLVFTSGTEGSAITGYSAPDQTITVTQGIIDDIKLSYDSSLLSVFYSPSTSFSGNRFTISNVVLKNPNQSIDIIATVILK